MAPMRRVHVGDHYVARSTLYDAGSRRVCAPLVERLAPAPRPQAAFEPARVSSLDKRGAWDYVASALVKKVS